MPKHPYVREHTMTQEKSTQARASLKALIAEDKNFLRQIVREAMQQILEAEMTDALGAQPGERSEARLGYRAGHYPRTRPLLHRTLRALPTLGESLGLGSRGDVRPGGLHAQGESHNRRAMRPQLFRLGHKSDQQGPG